MVGTLQSCFPVSEPTELTLVNSEHYAEAPRFSAGVSHSVSSGKSGCSHCSHSSVSRMENELADALCSMLPMYADEIRVNRNKRILIVTDSDGNMIGSRLKEIDILIPSLHVGIEFNGKYWHDDEHIMERVGLSSGEYDKRKMIAADKLGLNLLFVNENDWMNNRKNVLSSLSDYFLA